MIAVASCTRSEPLVASAVLAIGEAVPALARRLLELSDEHLGRLRAAYGSRFLLVAGEVQDLPWAPCVQYLGRDPSAPRLLLPTAIAPNVPSSLFEHAVARRCEQAKPPLAPPWAVSLEPELIFGVGQALPITRARLQAELGVTPTPVAGPGT